jgi:hypothetical protein
LLQEKSINGAMLCEEALFNNSTTIRNLRNEKKLTHRTVYKSLQGAMRDISKMLQISGLLLSISGASAFWARAGQDTARRSING